MFFFLKAVLNIIL